jgi:hypothetical protein
MTVSCPGRPAEGLRASQRLPAARDGRGQVPDLRAPGCGDEGERGAQRDGHRDSGAVQHGGVDDGRAGHVSGQPGCGEAGQPRNEQAARSGELGGPDQLPQPLPCSDLAEHRHRGMRPGELGHRREREERRQHDLSCPQQRVRAAARVGSRAGGDGCGVCCSYRLM